MPRGLCVALATMLSASAFAADTITATHVFPASLIYSRSFLDYVKKANDAGKGEFTIQTRGGPEAIPGAGEPDSDIGGVEARVQSADQHAQARTDDVGECACSCGLDLDGLLTVGAIVTLDAFECEPGTVHDVEQVVVPHREQPSGEVVVREQVASFTDAAEEPQQHAPPDAHDAVEIGERERKRHS